jgi:hypothetical protein
MTEFDKFEYHKALSMDRRGAKLSDRDYRVLATMWDYANSSDGGEIYPGHEKLAAHLGVSVRQVGRYIKSLTARGWIREDSPAGGPGRSNGGKGTAASYSLTMPPDDPETSDTLDVRSFTESERSDISEKTSDISRKTSDISEKTSDTLDVRLPNHLQPINTKIRSPKHLQDVTYSPTQLKAESGNACEDEPTEGDARADDYGREPTEEELHDIETDTDDWNSMTNHLQADLFGIEAERFRQDEENEFNRVRQEQIFRLRQFREDERVQEMAL